MVIPLPTCYTLFLSPAPPLSRPGHFTTFPFGHGTEKGKNGTRRRRRRKRSFRLLAVPFARIPSVHRTPPPPPTYSLFFFLAAASLIPREVGYVCSVSEISPLFSHISLAATRKVEKRRRRKGEIGKKRSANDLDSVVLRSHTSRD